MVAAFMVAMSADAQFKVQHSKKMSTPSGVKLAKAPSQMQMAPVAKKNATRRAASDITGTYILNFDNFDGSFTSSSSFIIKEASGTIDLPAAEEGGEVEKFTYNVALENFADLDDYTVYGFYNAKEAYIRVPAQVVGTHATYGDITFSAIVAANGEPLYYGYDMYLNVNEDGSLDIDPMDFSELIKTGDMPEGSEIAGFYNYLSEGAWNSGLDCEIFVPNAVMGYSTTRKMLGGSSDDGWTDAMQYVYVEDYETELVVSNFLGLCPVSIALDGNGKCHIPLPTQVYDIDFSNDDFEYGYMNLVGMADGGEYLEYDYNKTALNGFVKGDTLEFFKTVYKEAWTDERGEHEAGYYYVNDDPDYFAYLAVTTALDNEQRSYSFGICCYVEILMRSKDESGIAEMKTTKNNTHKVYNLMGQQVSKNAKGLLIKDGKKMMVK